eukprot:11334215-Heterocapsa_arctica.AAC.1
MWRVPVLNKVSIDDKFLTYWATKFAGDSLEKLVADLRWSGDVRNVVNCAPRVAYSATGQSLGVLLVAADLP